MNKVIKEEVVAALRKRDGFRCRFPGCTKPFTKEDPPTIDHWIPFSVSGDNSIKNLRLMHFKCNNLKGDTIPNPDGTITIVRRTKVPKLPRPILCQLCMSGRLLLVGETCELCGSGPQPVKYPSAYQRKPKNCPHSGVYHCWHCTLGFVARTD